MKDCRMCRFCEWKFIECDFYEISVPNGCKIKRAEYYPDGFTDCEKYAEDFTDDDSEGGLISEE